MTRVKGGFATQRRHKKVLAQTKGYRWSRHKLYRRARTSLIKALSHAYRHRRERKGDFRRLWIRRINAAARLRGLTYSQLIDLFHKAQVGVDRKVLADMVVRDPSSFDSLLEQARARLAPST